MKKRGLQRIWAVALVLATLLLPGLALAQVYQSFAIQGQRPFIRFQGTETSGGTYEINENAGEFQIHSFGAAQIGVVQTTAPTCSNNCGSAPAASVVGSDVAGVIQLGGTPTNPFTLTFNGTWSAAPSCTVTQQTSAANYVTKAPTTVTTVIVSSAAGPTAADKYSYLCVGVQ